MFIVSLTVITWKTNQFFSPFLCSYSHDLQKVVVDQRLLNILWFLEYFSIITQLCLQNKKLHVYLIQIMIYIQLFHAFMIHFLALIFLLPISINFKDHAPPKKDFISTTISCVYDPLSGSKCMLYSCSQYWSIFRTMSPQKRFLRSNPTQTILTLKKFWSMDPV